MLSHLWITNIVLVQNLELEFNKGLCVLTGETGAGKSILLDSLGLTLGKRASTGLIRKGCDYGEVSASFDIPSGHPLLQQLMEDQLMDLEETSLLIRRRIQQDGSSKAWLNGRPVTISMLRDITGQLVEIHGQFDTQKLLNAAHHRFYLDNFGNLQPLLTKLDNAYKAYRKAQKDFQQLKQELEEKQREEELLRHNLAELQQLNPQMGEEEELQIERQKMRSYKDVAETLYQASNMLEQDQGVLPQLFQLIRLLERASSGVDGEFDDCIEILEQAAEHSNNALAELQTKQSDMYYDPHQLEKIEDRLYALRDAARKFHCAPDTLANLLENLEQDVQMLDSSSEKLQQQAGILAQAKDIYRTIAQELSAARKKAAKTLDAALNQELIPLHLNNASFETSVSDNDDEANWTHHGYNQVEFCVSTHKGAQPDTIGKIASGGELARFTLALRIVLAKSDNLQTLILDEADTGISGRIADAMGQRLSLLSKDLQLVTITHSPQVAARGDYHYLVEKQERDHQTITEVRKLSDDARRTAIAAMLSGETITNEAKAAAEALLQKRD